MPRRHQEPKTQSTSMKVVKMAAHWDNALFNELLGRKIDGNGQDIAQLVNYLYDLSSFGINELVQEPKKLEEKYEQMIDMTRLLAFENYRTFITAADCSKQIFKDFTAIEDHLLSLLHVIPELSDKVKTFSDASQQVNDRLKQNSLVLSRHTQILEILEIPQLMDTCVRNNYYEEALELIMYVKRLEKKLSSVKIVLSIAEDVKKATQLMLEQLLLQLKSNVQLPACLRIIGHVRQLEAFTEAQLRIKFLQARDSWLKSVIDSVPSEDSYYHITKVIEFSRVHLFDIVTQYRAIFSDDDDINYLSAQHKNINTANILNAWIGCKIANFISILESDLNRGVTGRLDSVFSQCMYFGLSFGRVGADFRGLLPPIFNRKVLQRLKENIETATKCFEDSLATISLSNYSRCLEIQGKTSKKKTSQDSQHLSPPQELLEFPELAVYCNGVLGCFNELRYFAAIPLFNSIANVLTKSLQRVVAALLSWIRLELQSNQENVQQYMSYLVEITVKHFLPYISRCFEAVFKTSSVHLVYGRPTQNSDDLSDDTTSVWNFSRIGAKLSEFLPEKSAVDQGVDVQFENQ